MRMLFLLFVSTWAIAQDFNYINPKALVSREIGVIDVSFTNAHYTDEAFSVTATPLGHVAQWDWEVRDSWTNVLKATSSVEDPSFDGSDLGTGYFDLILLARNGIDYYPQIWKRAFVIFPPRATEGTADQVIDVSSSDILFYNYTGQDWSDKVIYLKNSNSNSIVQFHNLRGTPGHPVIIQKDNDNTDVEWTCRIGSPHALWFSSNNSTDGCRYVTVNGFNLDGTPGIKIHGNSGSTQVVFTDGKFTNISLNGIEVTHVGTADAASVSFIPTVGASNNITNWYIDSLTMYRIDVTDAGEEGFYVGYNNQNPQSGNVPPQGRGMVIARSTVTNSGRDGIQPGGMIGFHVHDNVVMNWGLQSEPDHQGHESCISHNGGSAGVYSGNVCRNGKMFLNLQSGSFPFDVQAGDNAPLPTLLVGNIFSNGVYTPVGGNNEPFAIYGQNVAFAGAGAWNFYAFNNIFDTDKKLMEVNWANGGFLGTDWALVNNIIIKVGNAGDWPELNFVGDAQASVTGTTVNNIDRERGSDLSDLYFENYAAYDYRITSLLSAAYGGSPTDLITDYSEWISYFYDGSWFPLDVPAFGFNFGAYSGYQKRQVTPP